MRRYGCAPGLTGSSLCKAEVAEANSSGSKHQERRGSRASPVCDHLSVWVIVFATEPFNDASCDSVGEVSLLCTSIMRPILMSEEMEASIYAAPNHLVGLNARRLAQIWPMRKFELLANNWADEFAQNFNQLLLFARLCGIAAQWAHPHVDDLVHLFRLQAPGNAEIANLLNTEPCAMFLQEEAHGIIGSLLDT